MPTTISSTLDSLTDRVIEGERITPAEALELYRLPLEELGALADQRRKLALADAYGGEGNDVVTYIIDRNINYTNICNVYCKFCAFYRTEKDADSYVISHEEIDEKLDELTEARGIQILMQGGHHPKLTIDWYTDLLSHIREKYPHVNIHGFSPPEFNHFAEVFQMPLEEVIRRFKEAGLGSIPGGGGEILVDRVRAIIAPKKTKTAEWLGVMRQAHRLGMSTTATMMYGHVETLEERVEHMSKVRELQDETRGFRAFISWTFQDDGNRVAALVPPENRPTSFDYLLTQAVSRLFLDNVDHIQSSWVTQGMKVGQVALEFGADDLGSIMIEENVVSAAGTTYRASAEDFARTIRALHRGACPNPL